MVEVLQTIAFLSMTAAFCTMVVTFVRVARRIRDDRHDTQYQMLRNDAWRGVEITALKQKHDALHDVVGDIHQRVSEIAVAHGVGSWARDAAAAAAATKSPPSDERVLDLDGVSITARFKDHEAIVNILTNTYDTEDQS